ncbi:MAG: leucine-rich repeat protein [Clostridia bacterium]
MKQKIEKVIRNKKVTIALMECAVAIGCIVIFCLFMIPKDRIPDTTHSYSKVEEVTKYKMVDNYITRVMPLTDYETFKEIAENTLNNGAEGKNYTVKVYSDAEKTREVTSGYIASGMIVEGTAETERKVGESTEVVGETEVEVTESVVGNEEEKLENGLEEVENDTIDEVDGKEKSEVEEDDKEIVSYRISVIGDMTKDGDINVTELTKITKCVIGLSNWSFTEEEKLAADLNGDGQIDITDIECCINYIVFGELEVVDDHEIAEPTIECKGEKEEASEWYNSEVEVNIIENEEKESILKTETTIETQLKGTGEIKRETTTEKTFQLEEDGIYVISSQTYGKNGNKSEIVTKTIKIDKEAYTIVFKDEDGTVISEKTDYHYGDTVIIPVAPTKLEDQTYTYEFAGWKKEGTEETGVTEVTGNAEYVATYTSTYKEYIITFKLENGKADITTTYHYGDTVTVPENPAKAEDETYIYDFTGWTPEVEETVTKNAEYTATYTSTYKEYTITFRDEDGTVISEKADYHYGDTVIEPERPTKSEDETYTYEFAGWKKEGTEEIGVTAVDENATYIATYTSKYKEYTITFKNEDGTIISEKTDYHYGDTVLIPENPSKPEDETNTYEFAGWKKEGTETIGVTESVAENASYIATYTSTYKEYTITFKNEDGTVISEKTDYHYGDTVVVPETPTKPEDETNTYEFAGWKNEETEEIGVTAVTGDAEYIATYASKYKEYTITFKNEDGTIISEKTDYHYGDTVLVPENPSKPEDETSTYEFAGWKNEKTEEIGVTAVIGDAEYVATYTSTYKEYTITFKNEDGTVISEKADYHYGDTVVVPENPTKAEDETYTYEFVGWKNEETEEIGVTAVTGDAEYTATYESIYREYTIIFEDYDGTVISEKTDYHYGDTVEVPEEPTRSEDETYTYEFAGWDKELTEVTKNTTYIATYINKYKEYTITFKQDTGNVISSVVYHYGDTIEIPEDPVKESTVEYAYTFLGWTPEIEETVTKSAEYIATYEEQNIKYTFIFYNDDGVTEVARIEDYIWGDNLKLPASPTKEPTEEINYVFSEWKNLGMEDVSETEKVIKFMAQYTEEYFVARLMETETLEGASYMTLQEAVDAAGDEERTVKLLRDTEESVLVEDVQDITIDLNGKTVTGSKTGTKAYAIKNYGTLEITDTTEEKSGKIQESATGSVGYGIYNREGSLTVKSGMIVTDTDIESGSTYAIYNQSEEALIIEGGTITAEARGISSASYGIYNLSGKEITVLGGTVLGNASAESSKGYGIYNATDGIVNVAGGKVKGATSLASAVSYGIYNAISENVTISGGIVEVKSDRGVAYGVYNEQGKVTQTDGTVDIVASTGYGFYNKKGTIDIEGGTIELNGSTMYGVYNETAGIVNISGGEIGLLGSSAYGIYNRGTMNVTGGNIVSKTENSGYGIYNASTIDSNISNISISKTNYGIYDSQGNLTVKDVTITTNYGIRMEANNYMIVVESADIVANSYGIYCSYGTVEIGIKDANVSTTQPNIYGETNAIYNELITSGKVKYYDGILTGTMVIYGGINEIEDNTQIVVETNENNKEVAKLEAVAQEESVVKIGNVTYSTLADAIDAVSSNNSEEILIEVIQDFTISKAVEISEGMNIKFDLAGHKVTTYGKGGITNNGTLEIMDTSSAKNAEFISRIGIGITNKGSLKISGGNIISNAYGIYNYSAGNIVIEDGTVTGSSYGIYNYGASKASITINSGSVTGNNYGIYNHNSSNSTISVNGGSVTGNSCGMYSSYSGSNVVFYVTGGTIKGLNMESGTINISGGNITGTGHGVYIGSNGTCNITGGTVTGNKYHGVYMHRGTLNMTGGKVVSQANSSYSGIHTYDGTINIESGEVEGYNGVSSDYPTIVIGKKDNSVNVDNPTIIGKSYGISAGSVSSILKIYDGKILGKTDAISGSINELEEGKRIEIGETTLNEEEYKIANLVDDDIYENPIVRVGSNEYKSFKEMKEAINNIPTNSEEITEITILNDFYMPEELEIKNGQKIILDLNGKTITTVSKILNRGTLQITDNTEEEQGKILNTNSMAIQNTGTMTITKGNIEAKSYGIYNSSGNLTIGVEDNDVSNIPVIKGESYGVYRNNGTVSMFDGTIIGKNASDSMIDKTEEDYKAYSYQEDGYYKTIIVELSPMARIGDIETSLIEAIALAEEGDTIEILRDIQVKEMIVVPEDKNITIDLKAYQISMSSSATNVDAILENRGTLNLIGTKSYGIYNSTNVGTTIINNGTLEINAYIGNGNYSIVRPLINNGTLDLLGGTIYSRCGTVVENNGVFNLRDGWVEIGDRGSYYAIQNNNECNILGGYIRTYYYGSGIINEEGSTLTMKAGMIYADEYGIYNNSDNEVNILGGTISRWYANVSTSYAIYNNTDANINIEGIVINNSFRYGIYNNANGNIAVSNKTNISIGDSSYGYGIYNNGSGNIAISGETNISAKNGKFEYGVYNNGSGNLMLEKSTISTSGTNQAYGIMNANQGRLEIENGNINVESNSGYAYGIQNGVLGTATIERANIIVNTTEGKSYGINNESKNPFVIKEGIIAVTGTQSTGIYSSASNIVLGNNDESITTEVPIIQSDNIGIYINEVDAKFNFYDGKVMGKIPINTGANTVEGYKIIQYYDRTEGTNVAIPVETDYYVLSYSLMNGKEYDAFVVKAGTKITDEVTPQLEEGYEFTGWEGVPEVMPEEDVTVYAILVPKTYTITYYVDGKEYYKQENIEYQSEISPIDVPVKEGNEFSGWDGLPEVMPAEDIEVKGVFTYFATFYNEDKTQVIGQVPFTVNDTTIEEPAIEEKEGYIRYWPEYELVAENIEIQLISVEKKAVINKSQGKSYGNLESAISEAKTDGTKDEISLLEDISMETTLIIPENTNIELDLKGHNLINNSTYCVMDNYGTLTIKNSGEEVSSIEISKEGTSVYGIYNRNEVTVDNVEIEVVSENNYEGIGIYNEANTIVNLGIKDEIASETMPKISATTFAISNEAGIFNFYDGYLIANSAINGETTETEIGYEKKVEVIEGKENCYLKELPNGTKLQAVDDNGITWNFTVQNKRATNVYYESGDLPENLVIPSTLRGCPVTSFRSSYRKNIFAKNDGASNTTIKKIIIPDTVTSIQYYNFYNCNGLIDVVIGNSVTSIGSYAFSDCSALISANIPDSVTSIGSYAFNYCNGLTNITLGNGVKTIGENAFYNCTSLTNIEIPDSVTSIGNSVFYNCTSLTNIKIPDSVTSIGSNAFQNCDSLARIDVDTNNTKYSSKDGVLFDKYKLTIIKYPSNKKDITNYVIPKTVNTISDYAFYHCTNLISIEIPNSVSSIGSYAFSGCSNLTSVIIPDGITSIKSSTFSNCSSLTSVTIPTSVISIESNAFYNCSALTSVTIPNSVTNIGSSAFSNCSALTSVTIPDSVTSIGGSAFSNCSALANVIIPNGITSIEYNTFYNCSSLTSVTIPNGITNIGSCAFYNCTALTSVTIPNSVTNIGNSAFYNCTALTSVTIPDTVTSIGSYAFYNCSDLTSIQMGSGVTSIGDYALNGCNKLERIDVDENNTTYSSMDGILFDKEKLTIIKYPANKKDISDYEIPSTVQTIKNNAFSNCDGLISIIIPDSVTTIGSSAFNHCSGLTNVTIGNSVTNIGSSAFYNCSKLTSVTIPNSVTNIGSNAFYNCTSLANIEIPDSVTTIGSSAFIQCSRLTNVTIGNSVTSIGSSAFSNCIALTSVIIPNSVTSIGSNAFSNCSSLTTVTIGSGITSIGTYAFYECSNIIDIYIDRIQSEVTFGSSWKSSGYVHYKDCTHSLTNNVQSDNLSIVQTDASSNIEDGKISCRGMYQFKLVDESGEVIKNKLIKVKRQSKLSSSSTTTIWIAPDQDGIYSIENIVRDVSIEEIGELSNGKVVQATDSNGITWNYTYQNGNAENIYYEEGALTANVEIPSEVNGYTVVSCKENMFSNAGGTRNEIKTITLPASIKTVNTSAFSTCDNLESIDIEDNNYYYSSLSGILYDKAQKEIKVIPKAIREAIIPDGVTNIGSSAFSNCSKLTSVTIPDSVTSIGSSAFSNCSALTNVTISNNVTNIENSTFSGCTQLTNITIPNSATSIGSSAFYNCGNLTTVTIGSGVTSILDSAFNGCSKLESINVSEENNTYSSLDGILYNKEQTEVIYIPIAIKEVRIPDTITTIENGVFNSCSSLTSITIGKGVTSIGNIAFYNCGKLESINVSDRNDTYSSVEGILYNKKQTTMIMVPRATKEVEVPNTVTKIENYAFYNCDNLEKITIGDSVTNIEIEDISFYNCSKLKSIDVSTGNTVYSSIDGILYNKEQTKLVKVSRTINQIIMPSTIETIGSYAFNNCTNLSSVIIRDGVKTIESYAFNNCSNLSSVTIPNSVTRIENCAFNNCNNLTNVIIGNGVTYIDNDVFNNCTKLKSINVSEDNTAYSSSKGILYNKDQTTIVKVPRTTTSLEIPDTVTSIGDYAFYNCSNLASITIPEGVTTIGNYAFYNCSKLANITIPASVTSIGEYAFYNCDALTNIIIPDNVVNLGDYAFYDCYRLANVTIGNSITNIGNYMFYNCTSLTSVTIPEGVTAIGNYAFYNCYKITSITIPEGVTTIGNYAFYNCYNITSISIPEGVATIGSYAFYNCSNVMNTTIPESVTQIGDYAFYNCSKLTNVVIPDTMTSIGKGTFSNCRNLTSVTIPKSIASIGDSAFSGCSNLTNIIIPDSVTSIGNSAFSNCSNLTSIEIPNSVTSIGGSAFWYCRNLTSVTIGNNVVTIGNSAFYNCSNLTSIEIPNSVTSIGNSAFSNCTGLTEITIPSRVTKIGNNVFYECNKLTKVEIPNSVTSIGNYAFYNCYNLKDVTIPEEVTGIGDYAFYNCNNLTNVTIPNAVTNIGEYAFYNCYNITSIEIPNRVTSIDRYAFYNCYKATELIIGNNVKTIGDYAFYNCDGLISVIIPDSVMSIGNNAFNHCSGITNVTIADSVRCIGSYAFYVCSNLTSITIGNGMTSISDTAFDGCNKLESINVSMENNTYSSVNGVLYNKEQTRIIIVPKAIKEVEIPDGVVRIEEGTFSNCTSLTSVVIASSVTDIQSGVFSSCNKLESINVDEENDVYSSKTGILYNKEQTEMIIVPKAIKEVEMPNGIVSIEAETFSNCTSLTSVIIPDSVTSIESLAFSNCTSLISITLGNGVTSISDSAFNGCNKLESIDVSEENDTYSSVNGILYNKEQTTIVMVPKAIKEVEIPNGIISIKDGAFSNCTSLTSVRIPDSITNIGDNAFYNCSALTSLEIPNSVTSIGSSAFYNCSALTSITIPNSVTNIGSSAFYNCRNLTSVTIPDGIISIEDNTFYNCSALTSITIPDGVTDIGSFVFYNCSALTSVTIPDGITSIEDNTFYNCSALTSITIPDSVTSIGSYAFYNCSGLTTIAIPNNVANIENNAFNGCTKLESINVSEENNTYSSVNGILYNKEQTKIIMIPYAIDANMLPEGLEMIETNHPYSNNMSEIYTKTIEGASALSLVFNPECQLEDSYDYIEIYDINDNLIYTSKGKGRTALANKEIIVEGDTVKIKFHTDGSVTYWGFRCIVQENVT